MSTVGKVHLLLLLFCYPELIVSRSLDDIEKQSQALLEKGKMAQAVVKLIEQLRQTILNYQVCTENCWV